ncbi:hypothetical protein NMG29_13220 [Streptomyces cocklensis]|jgi:hypothetical protein|uniref:Uncharacterized protein n=1 Tax=Actinacidiphila cocklensis TaxID=887465 RepID=A0A9W4DUX1_9ACTN|nr:hypothetical protein [Actinacidiphila cocklensis]MDD1059162.1 hypothetical protein [Actinacidiphila cocklensis]WSX73329.1 hypothetical protein OH826_05370 [Streptomyces sp. NBC_00899]WSX80605.1 hypothetical protein OH826_46140 [Streptomyces sp. NBC_00899]CAG6394392.1 conserved membrane hypothetical protein [Actinacidiphila cocklensis]
MQVRTAVWTARVLAAAGLAVDAYVHADLAQQYDAVNATISQGDLFRIEAAISALAALVVLVWRRLPGDAFAWLVAAGGFALLMIYRYVDVGKWGPFPDMYEPVWFTEKWVAAVAQLVTVVAAGGLMVVDLRDRLHRRHLR